MNLKQFIQLSGIALFLTVTPAFVFASCSDDNVVEEPVTPPDDDDDDKEEEEKPDEALLKTCQTILERIKNANLPTNASNVEKDVAKWMEQLRKDGSFPDINYTDRAYSWIPGISPLRTFSSHFVFSLSVERPRNVMFLPSNSFSRSFM